MVKTTWKAIAVFALLMIALMAVCGVASAVRVDGDDEYNGTYSEIFPA